jgi:hypothetical protein
MKDEHWRVRALVIEALEKLGYKVENKKRLYTLEI